MNPLKPSPRLLHRIARALADTGDLHLRAWVDALNQLPVRLPAPREFKRVSLVKTFRDGRLCGYEVWRHLESSRIDPRRTKARLWFGRRKHGPTAALRLARDAARMLEGMSPTELREWWSEYRAARIQHRPVENLWRDEQRFEDAADFTALQQMSHVYAWSA